MENLVNDSIAVAYNPYSKSHTWPKDKVEENKYNYKPLESIWVGKAPNQEYHSLPVY